MPRLSRSSTLATVDIIPRGIQASTPYERPRKDSGMTPRTVKDRPFTSRARPTICGSPPNRRSQSPWDSTATGCSSGADASRAVKVRPRSASPRSISKYPSLTSSPRIRSELPSPLRVRLFGSAPTRRSKDREAACQSRNSGTDAIRVARSPSVSWTPFTKTSSSCSGKGRAWNTVASRTLKIAVFPAMAIPRVRAATRVKPGLRRKVRRA